MKILSFFKYFYLIFAALFAHDAFSKWNTTRNGAFLSLFFVAFAIFIYFLETNTTSVLKTEVNYNHVSETPVIGFKFVVFSIFLWNGIAFVSSNKNHTEIETRRITFAFINQNYRKTSKFIATMLIGNNIALVVYGLYMGDVLVAWFAVTYPQILGVVLLFNELSLLTQTVISTLVILITVSFCQKYFFKFMLIHY